MGLTISHGGFDGGYISFHMLRKQIFQASKDVYDGKLPEALVIFLTHSDCDGEIAPETCGQLAKDLASILPKLERIDKASPIGGHIQRDGGTVKVVKNLISACEYAFSSNEPLEFY